MSQNPYANLGNMPPGGPGGGFNDFGLEPRQRTSALAVSSLVFSIICCVPTFSVIGIILGTAALFVISGAQDRVKGRGLAIAGIVLGLVVTLVQVLLLVMFVSGLQAFNSTLIAPIGSTMRAIDDGDAAKARAMFSPAANRSITDEQFAAFRDAYRNELGAFKRTPDSTAQLVHAYMTLGSKMQSMRGSPDTFPLPAEFDKGWGLLLVELDQSGSSSSISLTNLGVWSPSSETEVWLIDRSAPSGATPGAGAPAPPRSTRPRSTTGSSRPPGG